MIDDQKMTISVGTTISAVHDLVVQAGRTCLSLPAGVTTKVAPVSSQGQAYYWTRAWQEEEAANLAELAAGQGRMFHTNEDLMRYPLDADAEE